MGHIANHDRQVVVATELDRRQVHDAEFALENVVEGERIEALRRRVLERIITVDTVDLGRFDDEVSADFDRPQARRGIGREERVTGPTGKSTTTPSRVSCAASRAENPLVIVGIGCAERTSARTPSASRASRNASALMTVASMPM